MSKTAKIFFSIGVILLCFNIFYRLFYLNKQQEADVQSIAGKIEYCFMQSDMLAKEWLKTEHEETFLQNLWRVGVPPEWDEREVSFMLFRGDSMLYWSNYHFTDRINIRTLTLRDELQDKSGIYVFRKFVEGEKSALIAINLSFYHNHLNDFIFDGTENISVLGRSEAMQNADSALFALSDSIFICPKVLTRTPLWVSLCGWVAVVILIILLCGWLLRITSKRNVFLLTALFLVALTTFTMLFICIFSYNEAANGWSVQKCLSTDNLTLNLNNLVIIFSFALIYAAYLFNVRHKIKYAVKRLRGVYLQYVALVLTVLFVNSVVLFFHYAMVNFIYESNTNIELYIITNWEFNTFIFYGICALFGATRILFNRFVREVYSDINIAVTIIVSTIILALMIIPVEESIRNTGYILLCFHTTFLIVSSFRIPYNKAFIINVSVFAIYIMLFSIVESDNVARRNAAEYAGQLSRKEGNTSPSFRKFSYYIVTQYNFDVNENNSFDPLQLNRVIEYKRDTSLLQDGFRHFIFHQKDEGVVVVSYRRTSLIDLIAYFAYLFFFLYFSVEVILRLVGFKWQGRLRSRFADKIRFSIVGIVVLTMLLVIVVMVINTFATFDTSRRQVINNLMRSAMESYNNYNKKYTADKDSLLISWFNSSDVSYGKMINIYDKDGNFLISSLPAGISSFKMNDNAFAELNGKQIPFYYYEFIFDKTKYNSSYIPCNRDGERIGYLNIVQPVGDGDVSSDPFMNVLANLLNILTIVILIAVILSVVLYKNLTRGVNSLSEGIGNIAALKRIEPIRENDEISVLINQYNKMLDYLEESYEKLARSEREGAWRDMALQVAHEIKNPLTPMKLKIQMLQRAKDRGLSDLDQRIDSTLVLLLEQIDLLSKIATEFSDFSRMSETKREQVSLTGMLNHIKELFDNSEEVEVELNQGESELIIMADYHQLQRVFINLVKNAIQANASIVTISVAVEQGRSVTVSVKDNGAGIADEYIDRIFEPHFTTKSSGTGLGLSIAKQIISNFSGTISVESSLGSGTTFVITMPILM